MTGLRTKLANQNRLQLFTIRLRKRKHCSLFLHSDEPLRSGFHVTHTRKMLQYARTRKHKRADSGRSPQAFLFPYPSRYVCLHRTSSCMHCVKLHFSCMHLKKSKRKSQRSQLYTWHPMTILAWKGTCKHERISNSEPRR